jgi:molecular chaperone GrpE
MDMDRQISEEVDVQVEVLPPEEMDAGGESVAESSEHVVGEQPVNGAGEGVLEVATPEEVIAQLEEALAGANLRADQAVDQMQRTAAEFQNARRRQERQLQSAIDRATEGLIRKLLPVLDDFNLAFANLPPEVREEQAPWVDGFQRIQAKLESALSEEGVIAMPATGEFDPNRHEAITHEPNDSVESGHIIETLRTGYEYREQVLRPALVRVAQ